ncbi:54S ribosomal protein L8, mitochondrial [[Candida] anglica]|uniref:54S ribosomal protein L8, mitochondrial n=1 Tax=[Candida] anglica TaxID=148631 RepID=A0ABP0EGW4_9ASCO
MPALNKFINNKRLHHKLMDKNLAANLIRHEYIVTGSTKAKRAQAKVEQFLAKALYTEKNNTSGESTAQRVAANHRFNFLQRADRLEIGSKVIEQLTKRYPERAHGFTRIIKLEPRLGEDKAPMSVLELVDSEYEVFFWFTAKVVARLELQGLALDELTQHNVNKLTKFRQDGENKFRAAVEEAKVAFFKVNPETGAVESEEIKENLKNLPREQSYQNGSLLMSKKFKTMPRPAQKEIKELPKSPFLKD